MKWPWSKEDKHDNLNGAVKADQAVAAAERAKSSAERRWFEVNRVTDEFATAVEKAMRRTQ